MIPCVLLLGFLFLIRLLVKTREDYLAALVLFLVSCSVKIFFLLSWIVCKQGEFDLNYLQFVDEFYYVEYEWGDPIANAYCTIVCLLQHIGFSYFDLKLLNIFATSLALVRLYSLSDLVADKAKYYKLLLVIGAVLHLHIIYYSIFVLKDGLIFLFSMELFVQLIRRKAGKRTIPIIAVILVLTQLRWTLMYLFGLFLFDSQWRIAKYKVLVLACVVLVFLPVVYKYGEKVILKRFSIGLQYNIDSTRGERITEEDTREIFRGTPRLMITLALINARKIFSPLHQQDITNILILLQFYAIVAYLLFAERNRASLWTLWPILLFPLGFLLISTLTFANIRWVIYPFSTLIYALIFLACRPREDILPYPSAPLQSLVHPRAVSTWPKSA